MKKTYINPEMEIVKIETQQIIAASVDLSTEEVPGGLGREFEFGDDDLINHLLGM